MGNKIGGMLGASIRASNITNKCQASSGGTVRKAPKHGLDLVTMPAELFSAFGNPVPANGKSFLVSEAIYVRVKDRK